MQLEYAFLCKHAEYAKHNGLEEVNATGISANCILHSSDFSSTLSFCLVVCCHPDLGKQVTSDDDDSDFLYIGFMAPDKQKIQLDYRMIPEYENNPDVPHKSQTKSLIISPIEKVPIKMPGKYTMNLLYKDKIHWTAIITIREESREYQGQTKTES